MGAAAWGNWMYVPFVLLLILALLIAAPDYSIAHATILFCRWNHLCISSRAYQLPKSLLPRLLGRWTLTLLPLNRLVAGDVWKRGG